MRHLVTFGLATLAQLFSSSLAAGSDESEVLRLRATELIQVALEGEDSHLAGVAVGYARELEEPWVKLQLRRAAARPDPTLRIAALDALAELDRTEAATLFKEALLNPREPQVVRIAAGEKLPRLSGGASIHLFRQALGDGDATVRVLAAGGLLELGDRSGLPLLEEALVGNDPVLRVDAASELLDAGVEKKKALATLAEVLRGRGELVSRSNAAYALGESGGPEVISLLLEALKDSERGVRLAAANSLALAGQSALPLITEMAVADPDYLVRLEAIHGLAAARSNKATGALQQALGDPIAAVRLAAAAALGSNGSAGERKLIELVRQEMERPEYSIHIAAISALGAVGDRADASYLEARLADPDPMTRLASAISIHRILSRD